MTILYAHRGAAAELPENTIPSFRRALEVGADALETDVHLTRDGVVVVSHDANGARMAGIDRELRECTWDEIKSWNVGAARAGNESASETFTIPTLDEVLEEFPGICINIDLKQRKPSMVDAALSIIDRHRAHERVQVASFHLEVMLAVRRRGYLGRTAMTPAEVAFALAAPASLFKRMPLRADLAQIPTRSEFVRQYGLASNPVTGVLPGDEWMISRLHRAGVRVDFWTVNDADEAVRLATAGADGIMTDDPRQIAIALGKAPSREAAAEMSQLP